jgi:uncharacterized membrane protein HdeD (DUF308 family)
MTTPSATPFSQRLRSEAKGSSWLWLIAGILWILISVVILQFDEASAATVGAIAGVMLIYAGVEYFFAGSMAARLRWLWYLFSGFLVVGGMVALFYPTRTFFAIANILGFMMVFVGVMWIVEAFLARDFNDLWWLGLVAGILTMGLGFWLSGQFLITQAEALLVFAGVWAMMRGILDITGFFAMRSVADAIPAEPTG